MIVKLKRAEQEDLNSVKQIEIDSKLSPWKPEDYLLELDRTDSFFFVARYDELIVGYILARLITYQLNSLEFNEIEIYNIAVDKNHRRLSIGAELLSVLLSFSRDSNIQKLYLEVRRSNTAAQNFYQKHGFVVFGERRNFYIDPLEDAVLMSLDIKSI